MNLDQACLCKLRQQRNLVISRVKQGETWQTIFSDGWTALIGVAPEELSEVQKFVHSEDRDEFDFNWDKAAKSHRQFDFRIRQYDGEYRWLLGDLVPVCDNALEGISATFIDITERKITELAFHDNYSLIDLIFNSLHALIAYVGTDKRYQYVNRAYSELFDQDREDICGQTVCDLLGVAYPRVEVHLNRALAGEKVKYEIEVLMKEELYRCSATLIPHFDDGGEVKGAFVFVERIGDQEIIGSHLEDLERFMAHWKSSPKEMCHFVGHAIARVGYRNLPDLFFAISTAYFSFQEICERIDYIYENYQKHPGGECGKLMKELVQIEKKRDVVCLKDIGGNHCGIRVMLVRDTVDGYFTYSLRYFVHATERATGYLKAYWQERSAGRPTFKRVLNPLPQGSSQLYEDEYDFWNFRSPVEVLEGVIVYPDARGFYDLQESKSVADFFVLVSNLLGYGKCISNDQPLML